MNRNDVTVSRRFVADARRLFDIFIEGGYAEDGDEQLLDRLWSTFEDIECELAERP